MEKIAIISDIHGNIPALEAVLKDIKSRGIERIFCLGDLVGKGPHSSKAVDICRAECEIVLQGNWDLVVAEGSYPPFFTPDIRRHMDWHRAQLGEARIKYLKELPGVHNFYMSGRKVRLFHTSNEGVIERVYKGNPEAAYEAMSNNTKFTGDGFKPDVVGFADIHHVFYYTRLGKVLFNTGSVGNAVDDPSAAYVIIEGNYDDKKRGYFTVQIVRLPYDVERAVQQAIDEGMPDIEPYADELRYARYRGLKRLEEEKKI